LIDQNKINIDKSAINNILRNQEFFKSIDQADYIVWADCGPHFRNKTFLGYLLLELRSSKIKG
jgi:hypothetical protein